MNLSYKVLKPITFNHNKQENKLQRQYAAYQYISLLSQNINIINIDETIIGSTDKRNRSWAGHGRRNIVSHSSRMNQINMKAAISSSGEYYYTLNHGKTTSVTFLFFIIKLINFLEHKNQNWRTSTVFLIDNAPYHRSQYIMSIFQDLQLPIFFLGPYQYKVAPIELFFAYIKNRDLNPLIRKTQQRYRVKIQILMKEICLLISKLDCQWISKAFYHVLADCLQQLSMEEL